MPLATIGCQSSKNYTIFEETYPRGTTLNGKPFHGNTSSTYSLSDERNRKQQELDPISEFMFNVLTDNYRNFFGDRSLRERLGN